MPTQLISPDFTSQLCASFGGAGIKPGRGYRRKNAPANRKVADKRGRVRDLARLPAREVYSMALGIWRHSRRDGFSQRDGEIMREVEDRAYRAHNLQTGRDIPIPNALRRPDVKPKAREILSWLVESIRQGALGMLLSYEEGMAQLGCSRDTWWRWTKKLAEAGWIVVARTFRPSARIHHDPDGARRLAPRDRARNLYVPGPALWEALGGVKCLHYGPDDLQSAEHAADHRAAKRAAKAERAAKQDRDWRAHNQPDEPRELAPAPDPAPQRPPAPEQRPAGKADPQPGGEGRGESFGGPVSSGRGEPMRGEREPTLHDQSENRFAFPSPTEIGNEARARSAGRASAPRRGSPRPEDTGPPNDSPRPSPPGRRPLAGAGSAPVPREPPPPPGRRVVTGNATEREIDRVADPGLRELVRGMFDGWRRKQ